MAVLDPDVMMSSGRRARDTRVEDYPDRSAWMRALFGKHPAGVETAIRYSHPLIESNWCHHTETWRSPPWRCIIELWWKGEPSADERSGMARAAVQTFLDWNGHTLEQWESIRVRPGRKHPALPKRLRQLKP